MDVYRVLVMVQVLVGCRTIVIRIGPPPGFMPVVVFLLFLVFYDI